MKTSIIIIAALFLNTTLLVAEPLSALAKDIDPFLLCGLEALLLIGYLANRWLRNFQKACALNLGPLNIFVVKSK